MENIKFTNDCLFKGRVFHKRFYPFENEFTYKLTYFWIDIKPKVRRKLLKFNGLSLFSFFDQDHGEIGRDKSISLYSYYSKMLESEKIDVNIIKALCLPRLFNYQFNPISIFMCFKKNKKPTAIIFEVSNTFGERHAYICRLPVIKMENKKIFYVSPFFDVEGKYELKFQISEKKVEFSVTYLKKKKIIFIANFNGIGIELNEKTLISLFFANFFQNFKVTLGIYYEALKLWFKGATYNKKPKKPEKFITKI